MSNRIYHVSNVRANKSKRIYDVSVQVKIIQIRRIIQLSNDVNCATQ